jgi:hypothetical protein
VGSVRRDAAEEDIVFETIFHDFERLVCPKAVTNKDSWLLIRSVFCLGVKHTFNPLQANLRVGISRLGTREMPSGGRVRRPCAPMGCSWPDDYRKERPTVCRDTLDRSYHCPFDTYSSVSSRVVLTYKDFKGAEHA